MSHPDSDKLHESEDASDFDDEEEKVVKPPRHAAKKDEALLGSKRRFGIRQTEPPRKKNQVVGDGGFISAHDYVKKYPLDRFGEEMSTDARVWMIYLDEAEEADRSLVENMRDTLDVILVFAGLFSAVVSSFVIHTVENLEDDWQMTTTSLMTEMACFQRAAALGASPSACQSSIDFQHPGPAQPSHLDFAINGLFFVSLAIALCTALGSVLAKQWLHHYVRPVSGPPRDRARRHQFRYQGFNIFQVEFIVGLLPVFIHASLFLFFVGLILYLSQLNKVITICVAVVTGATLLLYLGSNALPIFNVQCPYQTPLTTYMHSFSVRLYNTFTLPLALIRGNASSALTYKPLRMVEDNAIGRKSDYLDLQALTWLSVTSTNASVHTAVCHAFAGIRYDFSEVPKKEFLASPAHASAFSSEITRLRYPGVQKPMEPDSVEKLARALAMVAPYLPDSRSPSGGALPPPQMWVEKMWKDGVPFSLPVEVVAVQRQYPHADLANAQFNASLYAMIYQLGAVEVPHTQEILVQFPEFFKGLILASAKSNPDVDPTLHPVIWQSVFALARAWEYGFDARVQEGFRECHMILATMQTLCELQSHQRETPELESHPAGERAMLYFQHYFPLDTQSSELVQNILGSPRWLSEHQKWRLILDVSWLHIISHIHAPDDAAGATFFDKLVKHTWGGWPWQDRSASDIPKHVLTATQDRQIRKALVGGFCHALKSVQVNNPDTSNAFWETVYELMHAIYHDLELYTPECSDALGNLAQKQGNLKATVGDHQVVPNIRVVRGYTRAKLRSSDSLPSIPPLYADTMIDMDAEEK